MNNSEWDSCGDPSKILKCLWGMGKASERTLRLFAIACCQFLVSEQPDNLLRHGIETAEQYAEGRASKAALRRTRQALRAGRHAISRTSVDGEARWWAHWLVEVANSENAYRVFTEELHRVAELKLTTLKLTTWKTIDPSWQCDFLRDVFGNPFRSIAADSRWVEWNDRTVPKLAQAIYEERAFDRLLILADALEEAGCTDADILNHCRQPGEHVRGCWVVDLLLGKS